MELDTGSAVTIIPKSKLDEHFSAYSLKDTNVRLKTYSGEQIRPLGTVKFNVNLHDQTKQLDVYAVAQNGPTLFGRDWLKQLKLDWHEVKINWVKSNPTLDTNTQLKSMLKNYSEIFSEGIGKLKGTVAKLSLVDNTHPKFVKARQVPYALKPKVEEELERLQNEGIISPIEFSDWATPIVPVVKSSGRIRVCGDYKVTLNPVMNIEQYPLPRIEDIFASLSGGKKFTKIDLTQAYLQMEVDNTTSELLTINTHKGLFRYNRLPFGIASAPAIWQRAMDQLLQDIPYTNCILDDMIITGRNDSEHLQNLNTVLERLSKHGLRANLEKCQFFQDKINYCGHEIDEKGLHKSADKVKAVVDAPRPENVSQVRSFLGLVNYYHRFIPNLATIIAPLNNLLGNDADGWKWSEQCEEAFTKVKELIVLDEVLCHYDPDLPVRLASDASPYGLGCVLSHVFKNGSERPIAFASRSLSKSERAYSQIDKEALGIFWSVQKFHTYLYGRHFTLITDHKPLVRIFHPEKSVPTMTASRLQRYAIYLAGHNYEIIYRNTHDHGNADALSRLPLTSQKEEPPDPDAIFYTTQVEKLPVSETQIRRDTSRHPILSQVLDLVNQGQSLPKSESFKPYKNRQQELTSHQGCLMFGNRVVIPPSLRDKVLEGHAGIVRTKSLARSYVWWPGIDSDIENQCATCSECQHHLAKPKTAPVHPWDFPSSPWERLHADFAGPFKGHMYLILVDAHSKWPEVVRMASTTSSHTIDVLRNTFARYGLPKQLVTDNGPQFVSEEFKDFLQGNGIKHITSSPYHPRTNGLAERFVQSFKNAMRKEGKPLHQRLSTFLCLYRNTPHTTTGETPAKLLLGRNLRTRLDILKPDMTQRVERNQEKMKLSKHTGSEVRNFTTGQTVMVQDYRGNLPWVRATIHSQLGPLSYKVETVEGSIWRRHVDQMRSTSVQCREEMSRMDYPIVTQSTTTSVPMSVESPTQISAKNTETTSTVDPTPVKARVTNREPLETKPQQAPRYPTRERRAPKRLDL
ncbi:uncharacterized protein K02A2.6-like [Ylistrum balloti]|uniref:uncharacterized protein K02A2.6-like n=1 Tax=Ylistrum balloti TaxID=509963 RepID=UPI002905C56B|nr:uncharacterized protein K02A2.6-like [Ylistrum balloti]